MGLYKNIIFPWSYDLILRMPTLDKWREKVLKNAKGDILEIGIGTGQNLPYYPKEVKRITAIEPNPGMHKQIKKKLPDLEIEVDLHLCSSTKLPFEDNSFDSVISTLVLCSIEELSTALNEIKRVLKPEGSFLFFDHGKSCDAHIYKWQKRLNPFWMAIGDGCKLDVPIEEEIKKAGFSISHLEKFYLEKAPKTHAYVYTGVAKKTN